MGFLQYVQDLYGLETLDTRFVGSSKCRSSDAKTPPENKLLEVQERVNSGSKSSRASGAIDQAPRSTTSSRWRSPEFYLYYIIIAVAIPLMIKSVYEISRRK